MNQHSISQSLLSVALIFAESVITLVLRFDANLRQTVYPLAKNNTVVCIRTYLPHLQFYATFSSKGVLLDSDLPPSHQQADVIINTYTHQLLNAVVSNDILQINKITMRGADDKVAEVRLFLMQLGLVSLFQGIIRTVKGKKDDGDSKDKHPTELADYKARIEEQQQQINALSIRNRELEVSIKEQQNKLKMTLIALGVAVLIAIAALIAWLI